MSLLLTSIHTIQIIGIHLGTTTTIQVLGTTWAITTRGTTTDTVGTTAMILGTTATGMEVGMGVFMEGSMTHTTLTCTRITADGTEDGRHTSEAYITIHHMQAASAA